ncbi:reverse transcriptase family protein [Blastopirellula marina]|uniref:RNA-directed DNA polymerase n=1 Tax=Blastopirellula marina TaxID=124 RepID=A0A2S8G8S6_9BACT|nr:reverse transcriptase family protein [Blastopirellula marina]PQO40833.1 RNA-directed DNA polymerase [Blastopirellula marina]PTL45715.1 RNA-directed DNA polymerase [Blastopirellula marina]
MNFFRRLKQWFAPGQERSAQQTPSQLPASVENRDYTSPSPGTPPASQPTTPNRSTSPPSSPQPRPESTLSGLDASRFQPLTQDEAMESTSQPGWRTAYWDPLNVIPSASLPRIRVIDQTMVGMGLIDAEELAEIHDIGEQMAQFRTDYHVIQHAGQAAVQAARNARDARKAEMKRLAAERKQQRQQAVAQRKATDIVFLGRGVSRGLADRRSNIERLQASGLPVLSSPAELAEAIGISVGTLRWLSYHHPASKTTHYHSWKIAKRSGGERTISRPHKKLEHAQRWVLDHLLSKLPTHDAAHGFVPGRSTLSGAVPHVGASVLVNVDLQDFFPTIDFARVAGLFRGFGYSPAVATILALLTTEAPRRMIRSGSETLHVAVGNRSLPQGACTSPAISNLICQRMDKRLSGMAASIGWCYTRYADDLSFSSVEQADKVAYLLARVRHFTDEEGFQIKASKTRVLRRSNQQSVTGIVVNDRPSIDRKTIRQLRAILHRAKSEGLERQNRIGHTNFRGWVAGMIAYVEMVNPQQGRKLREAFGTI